MRTPRPEVNISPAASSSPSSSTQAQRTTSARSQRQQQSPSRHQQRYHFNHLEAGMPVNIWGIDRRDVWRTCFCFHVRTVTIFIGVWHLMVYILWLSFIAAMFMYDPAQDGPVGQIHKPIRPDQVLPTPVSSISNNIRPSDGSFEFPKSDSLSGDPSDNPRARLDPLNMVMDTRKANSQVVLLTVCHMLITLLMVYGAVRGKPSYLMPFFVLRVFDFCIFCLTMVGYFSYLPNVTDSISNAQWIPYRDYLLEMDPQLLSLLTLVAIVVLIASKAYMIGVIWNCYKYLMLRNSVIRTVIAYRHDDPTNLMGLQQNLLPDLPDYDTAVNDPRYAKKPPLGSTASSTSNNNGNTVMGASTIAVPPPPPYSVAIAAEPLTFNFSVPTQEQLNTSEDNSQSTEQVTVESNEVTHERTSAGVNSAEEITAPITVSHVNSQSAQADTNAAVSQIIEVAPAPVVSVDASHH